MKLSHFITKKFASSCIALFMAITFVAAPVSQILTPKPVEAASITATIIGGIGTVQETLSAGFNKLTAYFTQSTSAGTWYQAAIMSSLNIKEYTLDAIAWGLINIALQEMIRSTTQWVNSGFQGSPAFISDLDGYMLSIGDRVAGNFIWNSESLQFLCSPFALDIKLALQIQYDQTRRYEAQCRLSDVIQNVDNFLNGNMFDGGWEGWFNVALTPSNNVYGQMLEAQGALYYGIQSAQGDMMREADWGRGFLTIKDCGEIEGTCFTTTPGAVIEDQLNNTLDSGRQRLVIADELNELLAALIAQVAKQAITGVGGLLGLSQPSPEYGGRSYLDQMAYDTYTTGGGNGSGDYSSRQAKSDLDLLDTVIDAERDYRAAQNTIVRLVDRAPTFRTGTSTNAATTTCATGTLPSALANARRDAEEEASSTTELIQDLTKLRTDYALVSNASTSNAALTRIYSTYGATSPQQAQSIIMREYSYMYTSRRLHDPATISGVNQVTIPDLREQIREYRAECPTVPLP